MKKFLKKKILYLFPDVKTGRIFIRPVQKFVQLMGLEPIILSLINTVNTTISDFTDKIRDKYRNAQFTITTHSGDLRYQDKKEHHCRPLSWETFFSMIIFPSTKSTNTLLSSCVTPNSFTISAGRLIL